MAMLCIAKRSHVCIYCYIQPYLYGYVQLGPADVYRWCIPGDVCRWCIPGTRVEGARHARICRIGRAGERATPSFAMIGKERMVDRLLL